MKERPILFSGPMVRAILDGRKTQTRRVMKPQPSPMMTDVVCYLDNTTWCFTGPQRDGDGNPLPLDQWKGGWPDCGPDFFCPYGVPGDRLWVRETWIPVVHGSYEPWDRDRKAPKSNYEACIVHRADSTIDGKGLDEYLCKWRPSIFMPRWASRITLEITDVRGQRLQDISASDCEAEGIPPQGGNSSDGEWRMRMAFKSLWDSINAKRGFGWDTNPWVWALTVKDISTEAR